MRCISAHGRPSLGAFEGDVSLDRAIGNGGSRVSQEETRSLGARYRERLWMLIRSWALGVPLSERVRVDVGVDRLG